MPKRYGERHVKFWFRSWIPDAELCSLFCRLSYFWASLKTVLRRLLGNYLILLLYKFWCRKRFKIENYIIKATVSQKFSVLFSQFSKNNMSFPSVFEIPDYKKCYLIHYQRPRAHKTKIKLFSWFDFISSIHFLSVNGH